ncbi:hypothetical protein A3C98_02620 [Candidatus Roizmanbacteria bacterium RIFCSPHIGHO2_02_FULL_37_15]|uniref:Glycosyltransferase 2-like domain-containing protein n=1 Tax=Candidatus Roizmanbacteria bacterium RIFCSPLOWO2_01_FULL_37_16 TaxID=1802058 RepID=A0A1F7ING0_9BACT|nr:MAG: hypothetical protein A2859_03075 [Candidatus Roizmanbacteria bacterium RIFCSPHIGHO2_01_FULL_37_16b]OGK20790.1 MAG: hypothetical protein A3C98_02620 [Candidatus Roizmanbacteria bacterium RIFCSPHIGHO2_02_FULL_37_15]OGK31844.1 MAG: hypothetical protein A3F57_01835 [Candidatus Roizmanbacteria bacterium RIFCSPHIGHO2_12_FULL_36_11]OGK44860.1 MAG: hypothetical protein A3B40_03625 [Candidatus Roizmanbacteria bacterium RIFCSPLOWO2_01_FULL_37_16]OGK57798.1 MAG: hypothetical protein A3I50_04515 [C
MKNAELPLISVIITTHNSRRTIERCLWSIINQTFPNFEIIVVDNKSIDDTIAIAKKYTRRVFTHGPERSAQRNFAAKKSRGNYLLFVDSDMKLSPDIVKDCVNIARKNSDVVAIIIPEQSYGKGFWAKCKKLERSFYLGVDWIEAARFYKKNAFEKAGGYDQNLISGEDWDLSQRIKNLGIIKRIDKIIYHNEGNLKLIDTIKKKFYYSKNLHPYLAKQNNEKYIRSQGSILLRYRLFFSDRKKLFRDPVLGMGMLFMKTCEFGFGALGLFLGKLKSK